MSINLKRTLVACLCFPTVALANTLFSANDIFSLEYASDVQLSPSGQQVVYIRNSNDIMKDSTRRNLWLVDTKTGVQSPLFSDENQYMSPRWSPDGSKVAFLSNSVAALDKIISH